MKNPKYREKLQFNPPSFIELISARSEKLLDIRFCLSALFIT